jgi:hypothetical protein
MRYYVCNEEFYSKKNKNNRVRNLIIKEYENNFHLAKTFKNFACDLWKS